MIYTGSFLAKTTIGFTIEKVELKQYKVTSLIKMSKYDLIKDKKLTFILLVSNVSISLILTDKKNSFMKFLLLSNINRFLFN